VKVAADIPVPEPESLECSRAIWLNGEKVGYVFLRCDLGELAARTRTYAMILTVVLLGSLSLALVLVLWMARAVSRPIVDLTRAAQDISIHGNYAIRAERCADGELGVLVDCFNSMLAQIEERDARLAAHRDQLEAQVAARTSELSLLNREITTALDRAETANRAKTHFLANMSHEIRTPMSAILGYADMLLEPQRTPSDRYDCLQVIRRNARHLMELINDILDISKIEAEKMTVEKISLDLPRLLTDIASMIRPRAIDKKLGFAIRFDGPGPARHPERPAAAQAGAHERAGKRVEVHAGRRRIHDRQLPAGCAWSDHSARAVSRERYRHRDERAAHEIVVPALHAGRRFDQPQVWRHRIRAW
jgi:signal transduction histidine kinase